MRKQYRLRPSHGRFIAWDVDRLADLVFPIIFSSDGRVMDGMHRVPKALLNSLQSIEAVRFERDPEPDFVDVAIDDLP